MKDPDIRDEYKAAFVCFDRDPHATVVQASEICGIIDKLGKDSSADVINVLNSFADAQGNINYIDMINKLTG